MPRFKQPAKLFHPWPRFHPPEHPPLQTLPEFLEAVNTVEAYRQKRRLAAQKRRCTEASRRLDRLGEYDLGPQAQEIIEEIRTNLEPLDLNRFQLDCNLDTLPTDELVFHLRDLLLELSRRALDGDQTAISEISSIASSTGLEIAGFELLYPEQIKALARKSPVWPIMHRDGHDDNNRIRERLEHLEVGQDLYWVQCKFKKLRGSNKNYPSRQWGKRAVRTLEECRWRLGHCAYRKMFEMDVFEGCNLAVSEEPPWLRRVKLPLTAFSKTSIEEWLPVIREMIRGDLPDFHTHADWTNQRRTLESDGRKTKGAIQNAILDDICSALKKLAC